MHSSAGSTSREVATVLPKPYSSQQFAFIRPMRSEDERPVARFKMANADKIVGDEDYQFLVLDEHCCLIGLYEKSEHAFFEAKHSTYELHWVQ